MLRIARTVRWTVEPQGTQLGGPLKGLPCKPLEKAPPSQLYKRNPSMNETIVTLKKGEGRAFKAGGLWIYDNEIESIHGTFKNGAVVTVQVMPSTP